MVSDNANDSSGGAQKANGKGASGGSGEEAELMDFAFPASMVLEDEDVTSLKVRDGVFCENKRQEHNLRFDV